VLGNLTDQLVRCFEELMKELRAIRGELALLRSVLEDEEPRATLRSVKKTAASTRAK
jgi:hypothetical protein